MCCNMGLCYPNVFGKKRTKAITTRFLSMKPSTLSRSLAFLLAVLAPVLQAQTLDQGQWNVNNHGNWFNSANWQNGVAPSSVGASAIINQDFGPGRMIADFTQVATMTAAAGTAQQLVTLSKIPVNGSISVTDGTFFWSQGRGASSSAWTVVYNSGPNQIGVTYNPALTGNRTLTIAYATADAVDINEVVGAAERIGATDGVATTFTRVLTLFPDEDKMGVTDGTYFWTRTKSGATVNAVSSDSGAFNASYDSSSRQITVTYTNTSFAVTGRNIVIVYFPAGTQGVKDLAVNTLASDTPVVFSRELRANPIQNSSFIIASGGTTWVNGSSSSPTSFDVLFAGPKSVTVSYKAGGNSSSTSLANLAGGPSGLRLITADYATASGTAKNVTLGNLLIGDISGGDRVNLNLNSLTFDTTGGSAQLNKINGGPDEIAGNVTLNNSLTMAVRTGGDVLSKNIALISANVSGSGSLTKLDSGNVALSGNNTYTGDTFLRNTGGTVFLDAAAGSAVSSNNLFLGNASRDGHTSMFLQLSRSNQIADNTAIWFDAASGRNAHFKMNGFTAPSTGANVTETIAGVSDFTGQGVIENTQDEADFNFNSVLTLNSSQNFSFNGIIRNKNSGASAGTIGITKAGSGTQTLAGNSIFYSGPTTVTGGTLRLLNIAGQGSQPYDPQSQTNGQPGTGGAYGSADIPRFRSNIANSSNVELAATANWTFGNVISGSGSLTKTGGSSVRITNANTYAGATNINNGTLTLSSGVTGYVTNGFTDFVTAADNNGNLGGSQRNQAIFGHGALTGTSAINLSGAALTISNGQNRTMYAPGTTTPTTVVFNQTNRVKDDAAINANAGTINFTHTHAVDLTAASYSETVGTLNLLGGRSQVSTSQAATGATSKLTFAGLTRSAGSTINFSGGDIGANNRNEVGFIAAPTLANGIIGGWATVSTINPADNTSQHDFATYSGSSVVKYSGYTTTASGTSANQANWTLPNNYNLRINGLSGTSNQHTINVSSGSSASTNVPKVLNTLKFDDSTAKTINLRTTLARTLILESGGLISRGANHIIGASATAGQGFLSAGPGSNYELLPWVESGRTLVINAQVADHWNGTISAGDEIPVRVVKSGPGVLQLYGNNLHTGGTTINQGVVEIDLISGLGPTPALFKQDYLTFNGGTIEAKTPSTGSTEDMIFENKMGITLGSQGGFFALKNGITTTINSKITGPGGLQMGGGGAGADSAGGVLELTGLNDFTGPLSVVTGQLKILGGSNTFGDVSIRGATLKVLDGAAWPTTKPAVAVTGGEFDVGGSISIGQLTGAGGISSQSATAAVNLIVDQDSNSTFTGKITESTYALSLEKRGKGTLILNTSDDQVQTSSFKGVVNIAEGVLQANLLNIRDRPSSIGQGNYDASVLTGDGTLEYSEKSASNLIIGNGAALSFAGDFPQTTNRPFTIGVGDLGASLLANSAALGNTIHFEQGNLVVSNTDFTPIGYDTIEFSTPGQGATLNLGGRNQGTNRFAMDLRDNGSAPLSLTKTGDGTWILGEHDRFNNIPVVTPSRNTFTGRTTIYLGTLGVQQNGVFGAAGGESVNLIGGNLDLRNVDYAVNEALSMAGGRLRAPFGTNAWTGGVSLDVSSVMEVGTDASLKIRGPVIGKGALIKVGFGTLTLENQNSFTGTMEVQEGMLRLDYTNNKGSKLPDGGALVLGGARQGATLDLVGGNGASIIEIINNMNVRLGLNRITRSDPAATGTIVRLNSLPDLRIAQGAALDFGANNIAQTDRLNNSAGLLGPWATVNQSDWATNVTNSVDGFIAAYSGYVANTWSGVNANVNVTASNTVADGSIANSLRFNQSTSNIVTLDGNVTLKSGGVLQTPATGTVSNLITGGKIILENNILGGNLMVHQHGSASALTIRSEIANGANPADMVGTIYRDSVSNRFRAPGANDGASAAAVIAAGLYAGMPVREVFIAPQIMSRLEPGTTISSIDYNNGNISFSQGATADIDVPISITTTTLGAISLKGETMLAGVQNRVRVRATQPGDADKLKAILAGNPISGGSVGVIPGGAIVTGVTLDNKDTPTFAILSINLPIPIPAASSFTIRFDSRNGVTKFGDGRLVLSGANTFTGPVLINGGVVSVTEINAGGSPGPLGAGAALASNIQISGGVLEYVGNSVTTDRGFTINELGSVEVARTGAVADFTGNLSGGVGAALGILEKSGEGTLKLTRILGNTDSPLPGTQLTQFTPATTGTGGGTNFGGFLVKDGTLKLAYENPNSNENTNRFAASTAALTMAGGRLELVGMDNVNWPGDDDRTNFPVPISSPSENRVQQLLGQLTLSSGGSEIVVTGGSGTTTTLNLQNPADPREVIREPGATVHFVENPQGTNSNVGITLSIPSFFQSTPLPWATYKDTSNLNSKGVNDFAAIEPFDDGIVSADDKFLYVIASDVSQWPSNQPVSEGEQPFFGSTANLDTSVYLLRFFNKQAGTIDVTGSLILSGGAILVGTNVGDTVKRIEGGALTSSLYTAASTTDLIIHNYNPSRAFEIASQIIDSTKPVNLVHTGDGTTQLLSDNGYSGSTYLNGGVLRLSSANALPGGVGATGGTSNLVLHGGVLGLESDFNRPLGTGPAAVQFAGAGGFAAYGATRTVNFGGAGAAVQWGQGGFASRGGSLLLSSYDADATLRLVNPINLGATYRQIDVADGSAAVDAELSGVLSGVGASIGKLGQGTLRLTAANTFTGGTTLAQGTLLLAGSNLGDISVGTVDATALSDAVTLQFGAGSSVAKLTVGNKNTQGISTLKVTGNSTVTNGVDLQRDIFVDAAPGRTLNINGDSSGTGRIRVNDGGAVSFNGAGNFGSAGGAQGAAIDGGVVVRNGIVMVGGNSGLGTANIELGDTSSSLSLASVDRSSAGRSVLERAGEYDSKSSGLPGDVDGTGSFIYVDQSSLTIDGRVYGRDDAAVLGVIGDTGLYVLINGESEHPERNGIYELFYSDGIVNDNDPDTTADTADDIISLRRVTAFDDQDEHDYGARISVLNGTDAGKTFFIATNQPDPLPPADFNNRVLIGTPVYWKQEASLNPNVSLLAAAAGLTIPNTVDVNNTNGTGATTLGGGVNFTSGTSTFSGNVQFQGQVPAAESKTVRFTSESIGGRGAEFTGVISEADSLDSMSVVKVGSGTVTFSGENTYKGGTLVNSGTLLVNNFSGSGTGTGAVTVSNFGSTLGGIGTIAGATSLLSGAALMPGDPTLAGGVESLLFESSLTLGADSSLWMQWTSALLADELIVNGLFTADATAVIKVLLEFVPLSAMTIDLIDWGSISAPGGLADRLDLPALASSTLFWDTSTFSTTGELSIALRNLSGPPPVHFSIREAAVREGTAAVRIAVELDWEPTARVTVPIITSGSATLGALADYTLSATPVTFEIGERSKELVITVRDDPSAEFTEKIVLTIGTPTNAIKGSPTTFTLTVVDNDSGLPLADRWDLRNPQPTNETLTGLALVDSTLVAVGTKGGIFSSADGIAWTKRPLPVGFALNAIASDGTTFVAVGENGNLVTSTNGIDWVIRSVGGGKTLLDVVWTGTTFVAVGVDGVTYNSDDGLAWTFNTSNLIEDINGVATSPSQLIAVGESGVLVSSSDNGTTWAAQLSGTSSNLNSVAHSGSLYVAVGDGGVLVTSSDGVNWTADSTGSGANLKSVRWDGSLFTAVGSGGAILTSTNGTTWTPRASSVTDGLESAVKLGSQWLAVGEAGTILTSLNATAWTERSSGPTSLLVGVAAAGSQMVAVGAAGTILTSPDGAAWTIRTSPVNATFHSVAGSASLIIAVGNGGAAVKSTNGVTWTNAASGVAQNLHDIVLSGGVYYAVGDAGTLLKTTDGVTWDPLVSNTIEDLRGIASHTDDQGTPSLGDDVTTLIAVGSNGAALLSSDAGATWTPVDIGGTASLVDIAWTGSTFVAVGGGSNIFTTTDGLVWTKRSAPQLASLTSVAGNATGVLVCGLDGIAFLSTDGGVTWQKRDTGTSRSLQGIGVNAAGRFAAVGQAGTILTTEQIAPPPPSVFFTLLSQSVSEETAGVVNVEVNISPSPTARITVPFTLTSPAGTATAGSTKDYTSGPASPLVFTSGQTSKVISITVKNDNLVEADETVIITLLTPTDDSVPTADPVLAYPSQHTLTIVNVDEAPLITDAPDHAIVALGASHTFNATATGSAPLTLQWQKSTANVAGALGASYTIPSALITSGGSYRLKASNPVTPVGVFSAPADLVVVDTGNKLTMAKPNATATLTVNYGGPATAFRWFKDNVEITADTADLSGFNKKTLLVKTLTAGEEGFYKCRVTGQAGNLFTGDYEVRVAVTPAITTAPSSFPSGKVGTPYTPYNVLTQHFNLDINNRPTTWTISGQPTGLSISSTGVISGIPQVSITTDTTYNVKVSASNATGVTVSFTAPMTITKLDANAIGAFVGLVERSGSLAGGTGTLALGGRLDVTTTSNAKFTGSLTIGTSTATKHPITGLLDTSGANPTATVTIVRTGGRSTLTLSFTLNISTNLVSGTVTDATPTTAPVNGWRNVWKIANPGINQATSFDGRHNVMAAIPATLEGDLAHPAIPQGDNCFSIVVDLGGKATISGKAADGTAIATTGQIGPSGEVLVYQAMYATTALGSFIGMLDIDTNTAQTVTGDVSWNKPAQVATAANLYRSGFGQVIDLEVAGGLYTAPPTGTGTIIMAADPGQMTNAGMTFFDVTGLTASPTATNNPNLPAFRLSSPATFVKPSPNPDAHTLTFVTSSGSFSGSFKLTDTASAARTVSYWGLVIPDTSTPSLIDGIGAGHFILKPFTTTPTAAQKSGRVTIVPVLEP